MKEQTKSNRELLKKLQKGDISVSDLVSTGGFLNTIQFNKFTRTIIDAPTIIKDVRFVPMNAPKMEINKIGFADRILKKAPASGTALPASKRSKQTTSKIELDTVELIAEVHVPYDVLEDNIERGNMEDTIFFQIAERTALDMEEWLILADTNSGDEFLALRDGILVQAVSHVVDFTGSGQAINKTIFKNAIKAMPNKYLRNRGALRHYVSPDVEIEYSDFLADRNTALGDAKVQGFKPNMHSGISIVPAALMDQDKAILTFPKNIILGMQRKVSIESDRDIRARTIIIVVTMRIDIKFEEEDAVVKTIGLNPSGTTTTTTTT